MMAAMMFPSVAPIAIMWSRAIARKAGGPQRVLRMAEFVSGYLLGWAAFGLLAFAALAAASRLAVTARETARWLGAGGCSRWRGSTS
jgi:predicted metal-binding membrane protein